MPQGTLFTEDFLNEGIRGTEAWQALPSGIVHEFCVTLRTILGKVANPSDLNEAQTEERIIRPVLAALGWSNCYSVQERAEEKVERTFQTIFYSLPLRLLLKRTEGLKRRNAIIFLSP